MEEGKRKKKMERKKKWRENREKDNEDKKIEPESERKEPGFRCSFLSLLSTSYSLLHYISTFLSPLYHPQVTKISKSWEFKIGAQERRTERESERGTERERENQRNMKSNVNSSNFWMEVTHFLAPHWKFKRRKRGVIFFSPEKSR